MPIDNEALKIKIKELETLEITYAEKLRDVQDCKNSLRSILTETYTYEPPHADGEKVDPIVQINKPFDNQTKEEMTDKRMEEIHASWMPEADRILSEK